MSITERTEKHGVEVAERAEAQDLLIALPPDSMSLSQDEEWCVVRVDDEWQQIGVHEYDRIFSIPGLYERLVYEALRCDSPRQVVGLLQWHLAKMSQLPRDLRVLDLGAGNGMVGELLTEVGVEHVVGVDIIQEAADAATRDRPGVYDAYHVADLTDLPTDVEQSLRNERCNCLCCVAALGFGDIPVAAFVAALNLIDSDGWVAFNLKDEFLRSATGFGSFIRSLIREKLLVVHERRAYTHRLATDGSPIQYVALVARKRDDIPQEIVAEYLER